MSGLTWGDLHPAVREWWRRKQGWPMYRSLSEMPPEMAQMVEALILMEES